MAQTWRLEEQEVDKDKLSLKDFRNPWNFFNIFLASEEEAHAWCRKEGLLASSLPCDKCDGELTLRKRKGFVANESSGATKMYHMKHKQRDILSLKIQNYQ